MSVRNCGFLQFYFKISVKNLFVLWNLLRITGTLCTAKMNVGDG